jgi:hypothetical protein
MDPTAKKNPWMYLGGVMLAVFVVWRVLALIADRIAFFTDPAYKEMTQARSHVIARQIPIRETAITAAILIFVLVITVAAVAWLVIYLKTQWDNRHLVKPSPHGPPAVYRDGVLTVATAPALPGSTMPNGFGGGAALPERVSVYDAALPRDGTIPIGVRPDGRQITLPLLEAGGGLIAGSPGFGKTELLASLYVAANRLYQEGVAPVEVIVVDPKRLDFVNLPRLVNTPYPVTATYAETVDLLKELQADMERRKRALQSAKARSVAHYHQLGGQMTIRWLLIDEVSAFTEQVSKSQKETFEKLLTDFNERGRAHGYTLVIATQRPHSHVISRAITGIVEWRVAFQVSTAVESRMVLDQNGAENLQAKGRFLLKNGAGLLPGQAYMADLKGRYGPGFYGYLEQSAPSLPPGMTPALASIGPSTDAPSANTRKGDAEAQTYRYNMDTPTIDMPPPAKPPVTLNADGFDVSSFPLTPEQRGYLFGKFVELGNVTAVAEAVYNARGGDKWHWVRYAVAREQQQRGLDCDPAWLNLPPRMRKRYLGE